MNWEGVKRVGTIVGLIGAIFAIFWYMVELEWRVRSLEATLQVLALSPALAAGSSDDPTKTVVTNPLLQACADLANKAADLHAGNSHVNASYIEDVMSKLNCVK
jgi:hypothetical protein